MRQLSLAGILAKNKLASETAWLMLLEIKLPNDPDPICLVQNNENIIWGGKTWLAYGFSLGEAKEDNQGSIPEITVNVDNTSRDIEYYIQSGGGGTGAKVTIRIVLSTALDNAEPELEEYYSVTNTMVTEQYIQFKLGNAYPSRIRRPFGRYMKNTCPFKYKGIECGCTSDLASCNHTLSDCRERNNSKRFGGFPGIPQGGLYA